MEILDTNKIFCRTLFNVIEAHGVKDVVCSPGSRNTPLIIAAAARKSLRKHIVVDERSAAFMALGISMVSRKPVALVCTSGTALLNYAPAIAEAYYQGLPLIVISADRPGQWIDQDDSQTIRQFEALRNFVKSSYEIPSIGEELEEMKWYVNRIVNDAMLLSLDQKRGPVHINVSLSEPLGLKERAEVRKPRVIRQIKGDILANKEELNRLVHYLKDKKIMLVAGFMPPDSNLQKSVSAFSQLHNVVVMAETISNLHLERENHSIDFTLTAYDLSILKEYSPDVIISIGGALVSRKLKEFLRECNPETEHWTLGYSTGTVDCFKKLSLKIELDPIRFLKYVASKIHKHTINDKLADSFRDQWMQLRVKALKVKNDFISKTPWSELKAFDKILRSMPFNCNLFLSNGTSIRYAQIINYKLPHASYCNRGVSGIDGTLSTAIGASMAYKGQTVLITGDLSFAYDIGAAGLRNIPEDFKIIVIDNAGGGIFRFVASTSALSEREEYFCAKPILPLRNLAEGFKWNYYEAYDMESLEKGLQSLFSEDGKSILKVSCPPEISAEVLKEYMKIKILI